jgi:DNA polymerase-3 subunit gamma/tau
LSVRTVIVGGVSLALYRRYRPETFAEVIGQEHVTGPLQQALRNNRVNHAYLFSGPRGCGKTTSARILARCLNCEQGPTPDPCGECLSCRDLARGGPGSIDVIEIDAASHGNVDDTRDLREKAFFGPASSRYKIYIIDEAHMVSTAGFNALLKVVEEPPEHLKFIFATTEPEKVIGTIRSRTHHYPFRLVPPVTLREYLQDVCGREGIVVEDGVYPLVVRAGAGSVRDSMSVMDQLLAGSGDEGVTYPMATALLGYTDAALLDEVVEAFAAQHGASVFQLVERVVDGGHDPRRFVADLLERLRDLVVLSSVPDAGEKGLIDAPADRIEVLERQARSFGPAELSRAADIVNTGLAEMRGATSPRLQLELICARVLLPAAYQDEQSVQTRLEKLERRIALGGAPGGMSAAGGVQVGAPDVRATPGAEAGVEAASEGGGQSAVPGPVPDVPVAPQAQAVPVAPAEPVAPAPAEPAAPGGGSGSGSQRGAWPVARSFGAGAPVGGGSGGPASPPPGQGGAVAPAPLRSSVPAAQPAEPAPPAQPPAASAPSGNAPSGNAPSGNAQAGNAQAGAAQVRQMWPQLLEAVKGRRRVTWLLLQQAQVAGFDGGTLQLSFANGGTRDGFVNSGHDEVLRQAVQESVGANWRVECIVDPSGGGGGGAGGGGSRPQGGGPGAPAHQAQAPAQPPAAPAQPAAPQPTPPQQQPSNPPPPSHQQPSRQQPTQQRSGRPQPSPAQPPAGPGAAAPGGSSGPGAGGGLAGASAQTSPALRPGAGAPVATVEAGFPPEPSEPDPGYGVVPPDQDIPDYDDPDIDETALSGRELIVRELGATIVEEIPHE